MNDPHLRASLLLLGDASRVTGGNLYDHHLVDAAPAYGVTLAVESYPDRPFPLPALAAPTVLARTRASDVVVIDSIVAAYAWPARRFRPPVVALVHQPPGGMDVGRLRHLVQRAADLRLYRRAAAVVAASPALADELADARVPTERICVAPPGVDRPPGADRPLGADRLTSGAWPADGHSRVGVAAPPGGDRDGSRTGPVLLCVANWLPRKGVAELLEAFAGLLDLLAADDDATGVHADDRPMPARHDPATPTLPDRRPPMLHLVGDDGVDPRYTARIRRLLGRPGLGERVVVHGVVPAHRVAALYRAADVFVLPAVVEPYGMVYAEALAAGLPVVGWRAGNLPNLVTDGREGLLVTPGSVRDLVGALAAVIRDPALRARLAAGAARRATRLPSWRDTADVFFGCLRGAAGR